MPGLSDISLHGGSKVKDLNRSWGVASQLHYSLLASCREEIDVHSLITYNWA